MPTRAERAQHTRAAIIDAAVAVLTERGYAAATVNAIAERAGMTSGAVYANFSGKRAVVLAAMVQMLERLPRAQSPVPGETVADILRALVLSGDVMDESLTKPGSYEQDVHAARHESLTLLTAMGGLIELQNLLLARTLERLEVARGQGHQSLFHVAKAALMLLQGYNARLIYGGAVPPLTELADALGVLAELGPRALEEPARPERWPLVSSQGDPFIWIPPAMQDLVTDTPFTSEDAATIGLAVRTSVVQLSQALSWSRALGQIDPDARLLLVLDDLGDDEVTLLARLQIGTIARAVHSAAPLHCRPDIVVVVEDASGSFGASLGLDLRPALAAARVIDGQVHARAVGENAPLAVLGK